jgi:hypothetical protein
MLFSLQKVLPDNGPQGPKHAEFVGDIIKDPVGFTEYQ